MIVIFHKTVSIVISWINIFVVWYKLHKKIFPRFQLVISYSLGSDNGLAPKRRQAIIWTNDNPTYRHIYAPVGFLLVLLANMRRTGLCKLIVSDTNLPLPRRHNEDAGVSNHRVCWGADQRYCFSPIWMLRWPFKLINMLWRNKKKCLMPHIWYSLSPVWKRWWIFTSSMWVTHYIKMVSLHCGCQYAC